MAKQDSNYTEKDAQRDAQEAAIDQGKNSPGTGEVVESIPQYAPFISEIIEVKSRDTIVVEGNFKDDGIALGAQDGDYEGTNPRKPLTFHVKFDNFDVNFESTTTSYVKEFTIKAKKGTFNMTNNPTSRIGAGAHSGSILRPQLTGSDFTPYMTQIELYGSDNVWPIRPIIRAKYPQPIKMRNDIDIIFRIKIDF